MVKKAYVQDGNDTNWTFYSHHTQMLGPASELPCENVSYFHTNIPTSGVLRVYCIVIASV